MSRMPNASMPPVPPLPGVAASTSWSTVAGVRGAGGAAPSRTVNATIASAVPISRVRRAGRPSLLRTVRSYPVIPLRASLRAA